MTPPSMIRRLLQGSALMLLLATPALAQMPQINMMPEARTRTPEEIDRDEKRDKAYRESLRKIPDAQKNNDPWGDVRGADASAAPKPAPKPKAPQPKSAKADRPAN